MPLSPSSVEGRLLLLALAAGAVFAWFFESLGLPGPVGALFAGVVAGRYVLPYVLPLALFTLGLHVRTDALRRYLPAAVLSGFPLFLLGAGLTALALSPFVADVTALILAAVGGGVSAPLVFFYIARKSYAESSNRSLLSSAILSLFAIVFGLALASHPDPLTHALRVLSFSALLALSAYVGELFPAKTGEEVLFALAAAFLVGSAASTYIGPSAYLASALIAAPTVWNAPRPLRKAILSGLTLIVFLGLGAGATDVSLRTLLVFALLLSARLLYFVVAHRFILPGTFVGGEDAHRLALDVLPLGAPFLLFLSASPDVYTGALLAVAASASIAYVAESFRSPAIHEPIHISVLRTDVRDALAMLVSLVSVYVILPLSLSVYWAPALVLIPFFVYVHALRRLVHALTRAEDLADAYLFAYALLIVSLAALALVLLRPSLHAALATLFSLLALYYTRHVALTLSRTRSLYA